jgi:hypothetical protein
LIQMTKNRSKCRDFVNTEKKFRVL